MKSQKIDKIQLFNNKNAVILFHKLSPDPKFWKRFTARIQIQKSRYSSDPVQCPSLLTVALRATDFGDVDGLKTCVTYVRRMARIACTPASEQTSPCRGLQQRPSRSRRASGKANVK